MEEENKKVTRRKFLEDSSRKALAGTAAAFLGLSVIKATPVQAAGCWFTCSGSCEGSCIGSCSGSCSGGCEGTCEGTCTGDCADTCVAEGMPGCLASCDDDCVLTVSNSAQAECGTPVSEQEATNRHVIV